MVATNSRIEFTFTQTGNESPYPATLFGKPTPGVLCPGCIVGGYPIIAFYGPHGQHPGEDGSIWPTAAKTSEASIVFASEGPGTYRFTLTAVNGYSVQGTFVIGKGA